MHFLSVATLFYVLLFQLVQGTELEAQEFNSNSEQSKKSDFQTHKVALEHIYHHLPSRGEVLATAIIVAASPLLGAGVGALIAKLNDEDIKEGAMVGAAAGAAGGAAGAAGVYVSKLGGALIGNVAGVAVGTVGGPHYARFKAPVNEDEHEFHANEFKKKSIEVGTKRGAEAGELVHVIHLGLGVTAVATSAMSAIEAAEKKRSRKSQQLNEQGSA